VKGTEDTGRIQKRGSHLGGPVPIWVILEKVEKEGWGFSGITVRKVASTWHFNQASEGGAKSRGNLRRLKKKQGH